MDNLLPPPPKSRPSLLRIILLGILILAAAAAILYTHDKNRQAPTPQLADRVSVLEARLQNLENGTLVHEKRLDALEDSQKQGGPKTAAAPAEDPRIAALQKEVETIKATHDMRDSEQVFKAIKLLASFHHLSDKVLSGKPFTAELSSFEDMDDDAAVEKSLAPLSPYADGGIPSTAELLAAYDDALSELNTADSTPPADYGAWDRFVYSLKHLVRVSRVDANQSGTDTDAIIARATAHLENEEIEGAVAEIKSLPDAARNHFASWLEDAQMNTQAPGIIDDIEEQVMQQAFSGAPAKAETPRDAARP